MAAGGRQPTAKDKKTAVHSQNCVQQLILFLKPQSAVSHILTPSKARWVSAETVSVFHCYGGLTYAAQFKNPIKVNVGSKLRECRTPQEFSFQDLS